MPPHVGRHVLVEARRLDCRRPSHRERARDLRTVVMHHQRAARIVEPAPAAEMGEDTPAETRGGRALRAVLGDAVGAPTHRACAAGYLVPPQAENVLAAAARVNADQDEAL